MARYATAPLRLQPVAPRVAVAAVSANYLKRLRRLPVIGPHLTARAPTGRPIAVDSSPFVAQFPRFNASGLNVRPTRISSCLYAINPSHHLALNPPPFCRLTMPALRSFRLCSLAVLAFAALNVSTAFAAAPFRLFEIAVNRWTQLPEGRAQLDYVLLGAGGRVRVTESFNVALPAGMPAAALGKFVVTSEAWFAFGSLGAQAVANFDRLNNGLPHVIAGIPFYEVAPSANARLNVAEVVNLSTRGHVATGKISSLTGGFVIHGDREISRRVLIRAIGPSLAPFGVTDAVADPYLSLQQGNMPLFFNGDWGSRYDADEIAAAAAQVGAFPLARDSKDAAFIIELPPGAYTASVFTENNSAAGTALLEIYLLP